MSENDKKINEQLDQAFRESKPVSGTDATGLIQGLSIDDERVDMYNILPESNESPTTLVMDTGQKPEDKPKGKP